MIKKINSENIRKLWIDFFKKNNHFFIKPSSLIPNNDPTLMWINSGIAALKPYFTGQLKPPHKNLYNIQRVIRTNDIENVGITSRHHTFFEMLGNFSINGYFKKEAIRLAWEFLTSEDYLNLNKNKLYITYYEKDLETYNIWNKNIQISAKHLIPGNKKTNFWEIGEGPCGPNTEIFYDRGEKYDPQKQGINLLKHDIENDRYIEIWNIVFSEYFKDIKGNYSNLPNKNIDTGSGLERLLSIVQDTITNYETDLYISIINNIQETFNLVKYKPEEYFNKNLKQQNINKLYRIIVDHLKASIMAINDGAFPSNKERGYIIRRLIRRAFISGHKLGINSIFLYKIVPSIIQNMKSFYKTLITNQNIIIETIQNEENIFYKTLSNAMKIFEKVTNSSNILNAEEALLLYESYGFPLEMIEEECIIKNIQFNKDNFLTLLNKRKESSRSKSNIKKGFNIINNNLKNLNITTQNLYENSIFLNNAKVLKIYDIDYNELNKINNTKGYIIFDKTPFYAEKGGQASDNGIAKSQNWNMEIEDIQSIPNNIFIHFGNIKGELKIGDLCELKVNELKREYTMKNHSGTHFVHSALKKILGDHIMQIGSYNDDQKLRIDFNHNKKITPNEIKQIEELVNLKIKEHISSEIIYTNYNDAITKYKALAYFGEKYDKEVRVVKFGNFSSELCGGTHCKNSIDIEDFKITKIESKGSTSFRLHALTSYKTIQKYESNTINNLNNEIEKELLFYKNNSTILQDKEISKFINEELKDINKLKILIKKYKNKLDNYLDEEKINLLNYKEYNNKIFYNTFDNLKNNLIMKLTDKILNSNDKSICIFINKIGNKEMLIINSNIDNINFNQDKEYLIEKFYFKGGIKNNLIQGILLKKIDISNILNYFKNKYEI